MKRICCMIMIFALLLPMATPAFATESAVTDVASYVEAGTGDTIRLETVDISSSAAVRKNLSPGVFVARFYRNGMLEKYLYVDFTNDILRHEYSDNTVVTESLSDVVTISKNVNYDENQQPDAIINNRTGGVLRTDYVLNEPFEVLPTGDQASLAGQPTYFGYQAMGYRGGYFYAPTIYGYLQRRNAGFTGTYYSHLFEFSAGTVIGTAASIIVAFFTNTNVLGLTLSIAVAILGPIVDVFNHDWSTVFEVRRYKWQYRIRLNSDTGTILDTNYRTRDFWRGYHEATGAEAYHYRGSAYDGGFLLSNIEMINFVLDDYIASLN